MDHMHLISATIIILVHVSLVDYENGGTMLDLEGHLWLIRIENRLEQKTDA